jgi:hypothetical protein
MLMEIRHREEVLNTVLAELIVARGMNADPETIRKQGRHRPDVYISFRGLRLGIEGKINDVPGARGIVIDDALKRIEAGLTHMTVAVVYGRKLRSVEFQSLSEALASARFSYAVCSETGVGDWREGTVDDILADLRRSHDAVATDDVVRRAAEDLSVYLQEVAGVFEENPAICDRLVDLLGIGVKEKDEEA